jgi:hypothetical protein
MQHVLTLGGYLHAKIQDKTRKRLHTVAFLSILACHCTISLVHVAVYLVIILLKWI